MTATSTPSRRRRRTRKRSRVSSAPNDPGGCAIHPRCGPWCARPRWIRPTSSTRFSWSTAATCARPSRPMPGIAQLSVDQAVAEARTAWSLGVQAVILFGIPEAKDPIGLENFAPDGIVQQATRAIKDALPEMVVNTRRSPQAN
ncbi:MAG: hypothetical protein R3A10_07355 [Caldilineaceae bacterium]